MTLIASKKKQQYDTSPDVRAAGIIYPHDPEQSADRCLKPDRFPRELPKNKITWNDSAALQDTRVTANLHKEPRMEEYRRMTHGKKETGDECADGAIPRDTRAQLLQELDWIKEARYHRKDFAPLGKSATAQNHSLPAQVHDPDHSFGVPTRTSDTTIKELVTPTLAPRSKEEEEVFRQMYIKSHRSFAPGEKSHRKYNWASNGEDCIWGAPSARGDSEEETVKESLIWHEEKMRNLKSKITTKRVQDYREKTHSKLGKALDVLKYSEVLEEDHVFGLASKKDLFDAGALINPKQTAHVTEVLSQANKLPTTQMNPITHLLLHSAGLDKKTKQGGMDSMRAARAAPMPLGCARHFPDLLPSDYPNHVFGIPSIRTDIRRPTKKGLADIQNYGDELDCKILVNHHLSRKKYLEAEMKKIKD